MKATDFEKVNPQDRYEKAVLMNRYDEAGESYDGATIMVNYGGEGYVAIWLYNSQFKVYKTKEAAVKAMMERGYVLGK